MPLVRLVHEDLDVKWKMKPTLLLSDPPQLRWVNKEWFQLGSGNTAAGDFFSWLYSLCWAANNLIQRPLNTQTNFIYQSVPRAKCYPELRFSESLAFVRMFTLPENHVIQGESLCLRRWEQIMCRATAASVLWCLILLWCFIVELLRPLKEPVADQTANLVNLTWQTGSQLLLCLFVCFWRKLSHISTEKSPKLAGANRFVTNTEKKRFAAFCWQPTNWFTAKSC